MVRQRETERRGRGRPSDASNKKEEKFKSEEGTPEKRKLNKHKMDTYLTAVLSKTTDRIANSKPFQTWKCQEVSVDNVDRRHL